MKVWQKLVIAPGVAMLFMIALGVGAYLVLAAQHATMRELYNDRFTAYRTASQVAQGVSDVHSNVYRLFTWLSNLSKDQVAATAREQADKATAITEAMKAFAGRSDLTEDGKQLSNLSVARLVKYKGQIAKAIELASEDATIGMLAMQNADGNYQELVRDLTRLVDLERNRAQESFQKAEAAFSKLVIAVVGLVAVALVVAGVLTFVMARIIVRPLLVAHRVATKIAAGDLTAEVDVKSRDESGQMLLALKGMNESLGRIVADVRSSTELIGTASREIAAGNQDLSQRTEEQASSLEETASSMEELTSTVKQNADNARQANQLAASASQVAAKGGVVVGQVVTTMGAINDSSKKIADIIGVIDGIAFQTNILALNAAVEAARAGEQGRGFAVVASEVRSLAQRSAAAAKEIKALIDDSVGKVDSGQKLVDQAGQTMTEVVSAIRRVTDIMAEITAASEEQSAGIGQVNDAITQMDHVTQQNAALVEQAAAAAESMQSQAEQLAAAVAVFKLAGEREPEGAPQGESASEKDAGWPSVERRGPRRAKNVARLAQPHEDPSTAADAVRLEKTGTDDAAGA